MVILSHGYLFFNFSAPLQPPGLNKHEIEFPDQPFSFRWALSTLKCLPAVDANTATGRTSMCPTTSGLLSYLDVAGRPRGIRVGATSCSAALLLVDHKHSCPLIEAPLFPNCVSLILHRSYLSNPRSPRDAGFSCFTLLCISHHLQSGYLAVKKKRFISHADIIKC